MPLAPFDAVVATHGPTILRVCRAVVGHDDAEDVWSETFIAALRAYPDLDPEANVQAWLVTIARRKGIDSLRASGRRAVPVADLPEPAQHPGRGDPADSLDLRAALADLPTRQRESVVYHHLVGLPYAEVAAVLGGTEAAARRAAADGMASLRRRYVGGPARRRSSARTAADPPPSSRRPLTEEVTGDVS